MEAPYPTNRAQIENSALIGAGRVANRESGRVASVRRLESGMMSVIIHMHDAGLRPGDQVKVGK